MALTLKEIPDTRQYQGVSMIQCFYVAVPAASDYPAGGWPVTAAQVGLGKIIGADLIGVNAAGLGLGYSYGIVIAQTSAALPGVASFKLQAINNLITITGGVGGTVAIGISSDANSASLSKTAATTRTGITGIVPTDAAASTDFSTAVFTLQVYGY
jgi:hypothetical protein